MKLLNYWLVLCARFDGLVVRERVLMFGSFLAGIYLIFDTLLLMPAGREVERLKEELAAIQKKTDRINTEKQVFDKLSTRDPDADIKREELKLQGRLLQLESTLEELSLRLVPVDKLPEILKTVSENAESVRLKSLQTLSPEAIDLSGTRNIQLKSIAKAAKDYIDGEDQDRKKEPNQKVWRHGIHIQLEGTYFEVVDYLAALDALESRFYWEGLDYRVIQYPRALVDIELYTLSTGEGMLGD